MNNIFDYALAYVASAQPGFFERTLPQIVTFIFSLGAWFWFGLLALTTLLPAVIYYIYFSFCLAKMAEKTKTPNSWFAWLPILNIYLTCKVAGKPGIWVLWLLIPVINIIPSIILPFAIVERLKKPAWWGILMFLPITNTALPGILAFSGNNTVAGAKPIMQIPVNPPVAENQTIKPDLGKKFCPKCGSELKSGDKFCLNCGEKL